MSGWTVGLILGIVVVLVAAAIVIAIVRLARGIAAQAKAAEDAVEAVRRQTEQLAGIARINDSGVRILHAARSLRKVAVGR
jgi:hypothetical protein